MGGIAYVNDECSEFKRMSIFSTGSSGKNKESTLRQNVSPRRACKENLTLPFSSG